MTLVKTLKTDLVESLKEKNSEKVSALRMLLAEMEKEKVTLKLDDVNKLEDVDAFKVLQKHIKKLDKEIKTYEKVGKSADKQKTEKNFVNAYLPEQMSDEEVKDMVKQAINLYNDRKIPHPMKYIKENLNGRADMGKVAYFLKNEMK